MCGICGFIGNCDGCEPSFYGLRMLLNRGYDSCGICSIMDNKFKMHKYASTENESAINILEKYKNMHIGAKLLMMHTRWCTTGAKTDINAHPHLDYTGKFAIVHNGIIENYSEIKAKLIKEHNIKFKSETDTEVIVNLISVNYNKYKDIKEAMKKSFNILEGTWGLVLLTLNEPNKMYCARHGSPLLIGYSESFIMVASEQSGFSKYVNNYICMKDNDITIIENNDNKLSVKQEYEYELKSVTIENVANTPAPYQYWTIKEINEQDQSALRAMGRGGRILNDNEVKLGGLEAHKNELKNINNLIILGCGTSYHSGLHVLNTFKEISYFNTVQIFDAGDFNKYDIPKNNKTVLICISQSGETKDLQRALEIGKDNSLNTIGVINVVDSLIANEVDCGVYLNAGKEIGVASTKAFTSQVIVLNMIAIWFAQIKNKNQIKRNKIIQALRRLPIDIKNTLEIVTEKAMEVAKYLVNRNSLFILGKGNLESVAKEGALKIKEIGYLHTEGYSTSALKHGSYALLEDNFPVIILNRKDDFFKRNNSVVEELKSRNAFVIGISDGNLSDKYNITIKVPENKHFFGLLSALVLQLISYYLALYRGNEIDFPRNLSKTISVD